MKRGKPRLVLLLAVAALLLLGGAVLAYVLSRPAPTAEAGPTLFVIQRSLNANEVHYDVKTGADGALAEEPVVAYWVMKAEDGHREDLTFLERKMAYGFEVSGSGSERDVTLVAWDLRKIRLTRVGERWRGRTSIDGQDAYLTRLFIQSEDGGVKPKVLFVDVFGEAVDGGKAVQEHMVQK